MLIYLLLDERDFIARRTAELILPQPSKSRPGFNRPMTSTPTAPSRLGGSNKVPAGKGLGVQRPALDDLLKKSIERGEAVPAVIPVDEGDEYSIWVSCK